MYLVIDLIRGIFLQIRIDPHGRTQTAALIQIQRYETLIPRIYLSSLLAERKQQILFQSPVQKCADLRHILDLEHSGPPNRHHRLPPRRNQTVARIQIYEYFHLRTRLHSLVHFFFRQQHFLAALLVLCQINTESGLFYND